jgi:hypothetical protein
LEKAKALFEKTDINFGSRLEFESIVESAIVLRETGQINRKIETQSHRPKSGKDMAAGLPGGSALLCLSDHVRHRK